ncbi:MAG: DUF4189 domain-containing protein [Sphingopyxis sp.]|uniref:DUF4189 domain-containing protein n=1 Tax=Sphingopyxis sp. TaxID=1908224 RepID=UPI001A4BF817|nr:DUF4189 domain-containing protein [Sphingopyxis sp.]MBL9065094.1 DUF4189 domain-containing protein [Sphingopyxis sp.]
MILRLALGLFAALALALFVQPQAAHAAYPCPGGPGPGEVQVGVSGGSHGVAAVPICDRAQGGGGGGGGEVYYRYGSIAWHPDADDVWMEGSYDGPNTAERNALAACNQAMGGGCTSIGEWHNSSMRIFRDRSGALWSGWHGDGGVRSKKALADCSAKQLLPCEVLGTYSSSKNRHLPKPTARKLYAVGAWVEGTEGFDSRLYIASGQRDAATAERLALDACTKATRQRCAILTFVGNGVIQTYRLGTGDQSATVESNAKRAAQAAQANCKKRGQSCTLQRVYDSRTPGEFVHDFMAPAAK